MNSNKNHRLFLGNKGIYQGFFFLWVFIFIFNPYTILGPLAYYFVVPFALFFLIKRKKVNIKFYLFSITIIFVSILGTFMSFINGIGQFNLVKTAVSIPIYILASYSIASYFKKKGFNFNDFIFLLILAVLANSTLVIFQVFLPELREFTEQFLVESGNRDWSEGFRYRGLASSGGASLSVLAPISIALVLHLYSDKYLNFVFCFFSISLILIANFFIGRTGFILILPVFILFVFFSLNKYFLSSLIFAIISFSLFFIFLEDIKSLLVSFFGIGFYNYTLGFLLQGKEGLAEEGTTKVLIDYITVLPTEFPAIILGYGFYGGTDFKFYTDSGFARMYMSVGYIFGTIFYFSFLMYFIKAFKAKIFLTLSVFMVLAIAELKEPMLFSGYGSRVFIFTCVLITVFDSWPKINSFRHSGKMS